MRALQFTDCGSCSWWNVDDRNTSARGVIWAEPKCSPLLLIGLREQRDIHQPGNPSRLRSVSSARSVCSDDCPASLTALGARWADNDVCSVWWLNRRHRHTEKALCRYMISAPLQDMGNRQLPTAYQESETRSLYLLTSTFWSAGKLMIPWALKQHCSLRYFCSWNAIQQRFWTL